MALAAAVSGRLVDPAASTDIQSDPWRWHDASWQAGLETHADAKRDMQLALAGAVCAGLFVIRSAGGCCGGDEVNVRPGGRALQIKCESCMQVAGTDVGKYRELDSKSKLRRLVVCRSGWQPGKMNMENRTDLQ